MAMEVRDGGADLQRERDLLPQVETRREEVDRLAVDVLHHEERLAVRDVPGVEKAGDVRVRDAGENLPLLQEALALGGAGARRQQLDGDALPHFAVHALGDVDRAHAAAADDLEQAIRSAQPSTVVEPRQRAAGGDADVVLEQRRGAGLGGDQCLDLAPGVVVDRMRREVPFARGGRQVGDAVKEFLDRRRHRAISLRSHACAKRSSRRTTCTDIDSAAADSSAVMPPK